MNTDPGSQRWAVVVAHPGHDLRVLNFIARTRPIVSVLTDGSASTGHSRLPQTMALLEQLGATAAPVFGRFTDREAYAALMARVWSSYLQTTLDLSATLRAHRITAVATDSAEGYNPIHDVCRVLTAAAVGLLERDAPALYEFDLVGHPDGAGEGIRMQLDDAAFAGKLGAVRQYAELAQEAQAA